MDPHEPSPPAPPPERPGRLVERRQALRRLRWRLRGAWQWPSFFALTVLDAVVLTRLPPYAGAPDGIVPALLVAAFANLLAVGAAAPVAGRLLRRRRPDLPLAVAVDYAGTTLLVGLAVVAVAAGLAHRPGAAAEVATRRAVLASVHDYVLIQRPALGGRLPETDVLRLERGLYRACVPTGNAARWLCLIVSTDQRPPGVTRDGGAEPNSEYRRAGGFG
jgi:hypothetical protein